MAFYTRSWLFVPGDDESGLGQAVATGADVIVADLADPVGLYDKPAARALAARFLTAHRQNIVESKRLGRWVRINPLESRLWRDDLLAVVPAAPDGVILPDAAGPDAVRTVAAELYELEQRHQVPLGSIRILPVAGQSPRAALTIPSYLDAPHQRLAGLTWGPAELGAAICAKPAAGKERGDRGWNEPARFVRAQVLLAAHACGGMAIDTFHPDATDEAGLHEAARRARADGFTGMFAIDSAQVPAINEAFAPSEAEIEEARRLVAATEASSRAGETLFDRRGRDQAQLLQARRVLGIDAASGHPVHRGGVLRPA